MEEAGGVAGVVELRVVMSGVDWIVGVARDPQGGWGVGHRCRSTVRSSYSEIN